MTQRDATAPLPLPVAARRLRAGHDQGRAATGAGVLDPAGLPAHWAALTRLAASTAAHAPELRERALTQAAELFQTWRRRGCWPDLLLREAVAVYELAGGAFYNLVHRHRGRLE